ncbi:MATE family efflux transporter [Ruminococcus sp. zg-921]|uniref:MATE family efflux transporter n=1 Tax=Ruminococcus sp. zg-921 TaxID=2678506 RepID=UPI00210C5516|nr:MATE family efflux transporter [Ruminococcus sp. zg-921]MCQ4115076.1 MATE family efflux transporter [Ruminococcus sp. zg-921]
MEKASPNKMGTAPMFRLIISMATPAMFSMIIQALYNIVDSIFVSQINEHALTAVSLAFPIQMLIIAVAVGTGVGINSLVARKLGEGDIKQAESAATHGLLLGVLSWIVFAIAGLLITKPFFALYTDNPEIFEMGVSYLSCVMIFSFGCFIEVNMEKTLQATGNMIQPMIFMLIGALTNIILDPMFIFGIGFFPKLGVLGAAIATVIGQILSMVYALIIVFCRKHAIKIRFKGFKPSLSTIKNIYAVGVPSIVMQSIGSVMLLFMNQILVSFSTAAVSVLGVYYKLQSFVFMPVFGLNQGVMPIMGYNYGAKNKKRLLLALKYGCLIAVVIMTVGTIVFWAFPELLLSLFSPTQEMIKIGVPALRTISLCFIPATIGVLFTTLFQAVGKGIRSLFLSVLRQLVVILPVAYVFSFIGLDAVWYAFPIAEVVALLTALLMFRNLLHGDFKKLDSHA